MIKESKEVKTWIKIGTTRGVSSRRSIQEPKEAHMGMPNRNDLA